MAARMGPLVLPRTPYAVSSARNNFKIDRYLNFSTGQISDQEERPPSTRMDATRGSEGANALELKHVLARKLWYGVPQRNSY